MHHMTFRRHKQLNSRLNFIGRSVPPLFTGLVFHQSLNRLFQERITAPCNNMWTSKFNRQMHFSLPSTKCSAAPTSSQLLLSTVRTMTLVAVVNQVVSIYAFQMKNEIFRLKLDLILHFWFGEFMRQARWNLTGFPICISRSQRAMDSHIV